MRLNKYTKASVAICNTTFGEDVGLDDVTGTGIPRRRPERAVLRPDEGGLSRLPGIFQFDRQTSS
eukprot:COSAG04_NODE_1020_length_8729_cov_2.983082_5_plen_65_part_00